MSQPNSGGQNLPNGLPPQFNVAKQVLLQDKPPGPSQQPFNGVDSSHSSRDSSPGNRLQQIPSSQLPPSRPAIPASQLPPSWNQQSASVNRLTHNYAQLNVSSTCATPTSSPKIPTFGTSTPVLDQSNSGPVSSSSVSKATGFNQNSAFSPILTASQGVSLPNNALVNQNNFTHSSTSQFTNVLLNSNPVNSNGDQNVFLAQSTKESNTVLPNRTQDSSNKLDINTQGFNLKIGPPPHGNVFLNNQFASNTESTSMRPPVDTVNQGNVNQNFPMQQNVYPSSSSLASTTQSMPMTKMHASHSQPRLAAPPYNENPVSSNNLQQGQMQQQPLQNAASNFSSNKPMPSYGSTPNLYQGQKPVSTPPLGPPLQNSATNYSNTAAPLKVSIGTTKPTSIAADSNFNLPGKTPTSNIFGNGGPDSSLQPTNIMPVVGSGTPKTLQNAVSGFQQVSSGMQPHLPTNVPQPNVPPSFGISQPNAPQSFGISQPNVPQKFGVGQINPNVPISSGNMPPNAPQTLANIPTNTNYNPKTMPQSALPFANTSYGIPPMGGLQSASFTSGQVPPPQPSVPTSSSQTLKSNLHSNRYPNAPVLTPSNNQQQNYNVGNTQATYQSQSNVYQNQQVNNLQNQKQYGFQNQNQAVENQQKQPTYVQSNQQYQNYSSFNQMGVAQSGFNKMWGHDNYDLLQCPNILPPTKLEAPKVSLGQEYLDAANCSSDVFRCTMTKIPESNSLLQKSRLPLGVLIHPFRDLNHLPVIQCNTIVRCRACRTYINPFVFFVDTKRWKCNLCYRVNELPEEFQYDPVSKTYGDPSRRPEIKSSTIEYIAPSEYMLRPPQPAVYIFLLDVSRGAVESGYLHTFCSVLAANLTSLPGDARMQIGFIAYNSALHFYSLAEGISQPHEMTVLDIDDMFLPCPDNLVVNLQERMELVSDLLTQLPTRFNNSFDTNSALGAALQAAHKMVSSTGGRVTVFQASLPNIGPGALTPREDPSQRAAAEVPHLNPANDFYKRLALECSAQQIAVDLFLVNSQYVDLATISGISRFSGGCMHHFPLFKASRPLQSESLERSLKRYLTRKIGFEAVMRIRCTRGLSIHTFHGNFFVRSTDLLSLPNVNPDAGFGMQVSIDESLSDLQTVCFQAALLYTSSKGERRIRVHTLCIPIASTLSDIVNSADQQCIIGLLAKMAVDRSMQSSLLDAREAFINVAIDILSSYKMSLNMESGSSGLLAPHCLKLLPLYISALLKHIAFRTGTSTRLDDRVKAMCDLKVLPLFILIQQIYPDLYPIHNLEEQTMIANEDGEPVSVPPHLQLTARSLESKGAYLMNIGDHMILYVCPAVSPVFLEALGAPDYNSLSDQMYELPILETPQNQRLHNFVNYLNDEKPFMATLQVIKDNSSQRHLFIERLVEDRVETALSYHEFLQHLKTQVK